MRKNHSISMRTCPPKPKAKALWRRRILSIITLATFIATQCGIGTAFALRAKAVGETDVASAIGHALATGATGYYIEPQVKIRDDLLEIPLNEVVLRVVVQSDRRGIFSINLGYIDPATGSFISFDRGISEMKFKRVGIQVEGQEMLYYSPMYEHYLEDFIRNELIYFIDNEWYNKSKTLDDLESSLKARYADQMREGNKTLGLIFGNHLTARDKSYMRFIAVISRALFEMGEPGAGDTFTVSFDTPFYNQAVDDFRKDFDSRFSEMQVLYEEFSGSHQERYAALTRQIRSCMDGMRQFLTGVKDIPDHVICSIMLDYYRKSLVRPRDLTDIPKLNSQRVTALFALFSMTTRPSIAPILEAVVEVEDRLNDDVRSKDMNHMFWLAQSGINYHRPEDVFSIVINELKSFAPPAYDPEILALAADIRPAPAVVEQEISKPPDSKPRAMLSKLWQHLLVLSKIKESPDLVEFKNEFDQKFAELAGLFQQWQQMVEERESGAPAEEGQNGENRYDRHLALLNQKIAEAGAWIDYWLFQHKEVNPERVFRHILAYYAGSFEANSRSELLLPQRFAALCVLAAIQDTRVIKSQEFVWNAETALDYELRDGIGLNMVTCFRGTFKDIVGTLKAAAEVSDTQKAILRQAAKKSGVKLPGSLHVSTVLDKPPAGVVAKQIVEAPVDEAERIVEEEQAEEASAVGKADAALKAKAERGVAALRSMSHKGGEYADIIKSLASIKCCVDLIFDEDRTDISPEARRLQLMVSNLKEELRIAASESTDDIRQKMIAHPDYVEKKLKRLVSMLERLQKKFEELQKKGHTRIGHNDIVILPSDYKKGNITQEDFKEYCGIICSEIELLNNILRDRLALVQGDEVDKENVDIAKIAEKFTIDARIKWYIRVSPGAAIEANRIRVGNVFSNLVQNAKKWSLKWANEHPGEKPGIGIHIIKRKNKSIVITVSDNGAGVPEDGLVTDSITSMPVVCRPDYTNGGTGIGLHEVWVVTNGNVSVRNRRPPGHGAIFTVTIPSEGWSYNVPIGVGFEDKVVVIVDTDIINAEVTKGRLISKGFEAGNIREVVMADLDVDMEQIRQRIDNAAAGESVYLLIVPDKLLDSIKSNLVDINAAGHDWEEKLDAIAASAGATKISV